jgi:hypothetical protein
LSVRVTLVLGRFRVVGVVDSPSSSSSRVRGDREAGFLLGDDSEESAVLEGVRSGLMSLVTGGLVLVTVAVVVNVEVDDLDSVDENAGPT